MPKIHAATIQESIILPTVAIDGDIYHILKVRLLSRHIGKPPEVIEADIRRPKYFTPSEAVEYGIIDKVPFYKSNIPPFNTPPVQEKDKQKEKATLSKINSTIRFPSHVCF